MDTVLDAEKLPRSVHSHKRWNGDIHPDRRGFSQAGHTFRGLNWDKLKYLNYNRSRLNIFIVDGHFSLLKYLVKAQQSYPTTLVVRQVKLAIFLWVWIKH